MAGWPWPLDSVQSWFEDLWNLIVGTPTTTFNLTWTSDLYNWLQPIWDWFGSTSWYVQQTYTWFVSILSDTGGIWRFLTVDTWNELVHILTETLKVVPSLDPVIRWTQSSLATMLQGTTDLIELITPTFETYIEISNGVLSLDITEKISESATTMTSEFNEFSSWVNADVLDPWSDWLEDISVSLAFLDPTSDKFMFKDQVKWNQDFWKWTSEQIPTLMKLLTFSVTQDIFGEIQWISEQATSYSESGFDGIKGYIDTIEHTSPDRILDVTFEFFKAQSVLRNDGVTWTQSLQTNPALRGLDFTEMFAHGEWQMFLLGLAGGFGTGIVSMVISKPLAYWFNERIRPEILDVETLRTSYLRGEITDDDVQWGLSHWGFDDNKISTIKKTWKWIPGPTDLIRLAVRESFTPPLVLDYESADYKKWMKKQGAEDWSDMFWHAHWVLPSISELSEMVHRNVIDDETWKKFVTLNDYWPPMVDNFKKIIYTPFTRVDIRRMYNSGVLDEAGVKRGYLDIGYDDEKATKLTEFTKALKTGTAKDLTLSMITNAFKQGNVSHDVALEMIVDLGYEEDEADFILALYEQQTKQESRELSQSKFDAMFQLGLIDREELKRNLIALNYSTDAAENLVKIEEVKRDGKITLLPLGTLREALRRKIIEPEDFTTRAKRLGYQDDEIEIVIQLEGARAAA